MKNKLRILASVLFFFFTTQSFSSPISKINFIGLNNASEESLLQLIPFKAGQEYTSALSDGIIESLFKTGLFSDISISNNENSLNITLKENPVIKYFEISLDSGSGFTNWLKGEKMLMPSDLLEEELTNNMLSAGNPYTQRKLDNFILMLESKYAESGYYNAKISPNVVY
jgi:outer membrane protein insertion porin family